MGERKRLEEIAASAITSGTIAAGATMRPAPTLPIVVSRVCSSRLERLGDKIVRVHLCPQEECEHGEVAGRDDLRVDNFPPVHVVGEVRDAACEVNGEGCDGSDGSVGECAERLGEGDNPVFGHGPEPTEGAV